MVRGEGAALARESVSSLVHEPSEMVWFKTIIFLFLVSFSVNNELAREPLLHIVTAEGAHVSTVGRARLSGNEALHL